MRSHLPGVIRGKRHDETIKKASAPAGPFQEKSIHLWRQPDAGKNLRDLGLRSNGNAIQSEGPSAFFGEVGPRAQ
ncbi:hypothetical protein AA100600_1256 [Gluconobacter thailandicus F149-1 = NBRC 100600]|nr:hypothetical protein AA100600_1256 [Gluconobacter thailandicus F149-1 = NBRC 100600]